MARSLPEKLFRGVVLVLFVVIVVAGLVLAYPSWQRGRDLRRQEADLRREIEERKAEIALLRENQQRMKTDPDFVEAIARRHRRVFPGEIVFLFED